MATLTENQNTINAVLINLYPLSKKLLPKEFNDYIDIINQINDPELQINQYLGKEPFISIDSLYLKLAMRNLDRALIENINRELLEFFPYANPLTDEDYLINRDVKKLKNYIATINVHNNLNKYAKLKDLYKTIADRPQRKNNPNYLSMRKSVITGFELSETKDQYLVDSLIHDAYYETITCPEYDSYRIIERLDEWIYYCKLVDELIIYIKEKFPKWDTTPWDKKNDYINKLKLSLEPSFIDKNQSLISYINYLENYGLGSSKKAKSEYLLNLKLPNITEISTAKKITKYSNLIK